MILSVSQLAHKDTQKLVSMLKSVDIDCIESVFSLIKPWDRITSIDVSLFNINLKNTGLRSLSAQSLFYGTDITIDDLNACLRHIQRVMLFGRIMGLKVLVFGSPNLRKSKEKLDDFLREVDPMLNGTGMRLVIEPNCKLYNGDFFYTVPEIVEYLNSRPFRNIGTMIDYHNLLAENEDPSKTLKEYINKVWHIHISEPNLKPIDDVQKHKIFSDTIKEVNYSGIVTYELLQSGLNDDEVLESVTTFKKLYGAN